MSRHRNVRQMLDEYYDDYDDDDYDYDDYPPPPKSATKPQQQQQQQQPKQQLNKQQTKQQQKQQQQPKAIPQSKTKKESSPPAPVSVKGVANKPNSSKTQQQATATPSSAAGVTTVTPPTTTTATTALHAQTTTPTPPAAPPVPAELLNPQRKIPFTLVILGHVDAGKSTVTGHLLYATSSTMKKPDNFAYVCDEDDQERSHGITMDIATKTLVTEKFSFVLQDAPGHADYIPAMITGTSHADGALLVVDATDLATALYHGQLKEHIYVMRGMGVAQVLVVVNKMDLVEWKAEVYQETCDKVNRFLIQVGFAQPKIRFVPVSGLTGINIAKPERNNLGWYYNNNNSNNKKSPAMPLLAALDGFEAPPALAAKLGKPLRIVVMDVVGDQGRGVAVRVKVVQGWVQSGESLVVMPIGDSITIQKFASLQQQSSSSSSMQLAAAPEVLDGTLMGIDATRVSVGSVIARPGALPALASKCRCKLWVLEGLTIPILRGTQAIFHISHLDVPCHVSQLIQVVTKNTTHMRPKAIGSNSQAEVDIVLSSPIVLEAFADCRALGRFVLRRGGDSIAVGRIQELLF